jgi:Immunoglobulin domain/Immunoglobulin I-set domain
MKKLFIVLLTNLVLLTVDVAAQAIYTVTTASPNYSASGGQVTFNVSLSFPAGAIPSIDAKPPASTWAYVSESGANIPNIKPNAGDTTDPAVSSSVFGFIYISPPSGSAAFSFVVSYPAGLTGNQVIALTADYRLNGVRTPVTVAAITLSPVSGDVAPTVSVQPQSLTVTAGQSATFGVTAAGTPTPTYQWKKGGVELAGATGSSYTIPSAAAGDAGSYTVVVSNRAGNVTSSAAVLTVSPGDAFYTATANPTNYAAGGGQITFNVSMSFPAGAVPSISAKPSATTWAYVSESGTNIPTVKPNAGDTTVPSDSSSSFGFSYISPPSGSASFSFVLSYPANLTGSQTIAFAASYRLNGVLTPVIVPAIVLPGASSDIAITTPPANVTKNQGQTAIFTVVASGNPTLSYQWKKGGSNLTDGGNVSGATTATLTLSNVQASDAASYSVYVSNTQSNITSPPATLTVIVPPVITTQPVSQAVTVGQGASISVVATGPGSLTYQWYFTPLTSGTPQALSDVTGKLAGTRTANLALTNAQAADAGDYVCTVTNAAGSTPSSAAQLSVASRIVRIVSQTAAPGAQIVVPVQLVAAGDENAVSFSLNFDVSKITYVSSALGADATGASLTRNVTQAAGGVLTYLVGKEPGTVFTAGTSNILTITFAVSSTATDGAMLTLAFSDTPTLRKIINVGGDVALSGAFQSGAVTVTSGYEGDVNGDGVVDAADWVKLGRIVVGLDPMPTGAVFMKADAAPKATKGDGVVDAGDWVQLGRFVVGLDTPQSAGGPTAPTQ